MSYSQEIRKLSTVFASWSPAALAEAAASAEKMVARHGSIAKARDCIADLSGGNVSLQCRAHFQPIDHVLAAMEQGYVL